MLTPEATNLLGASRELQDRILHVEAEDPTLAALREDARNLGIWLLIGSLSLKTGVPGEDRFANRSFRRSRPMVASRRAMTSCTCST